MVNHLDAHVLGCPGSSFEDAENGWLRSTSSTSALRDSGVHQGPVHGLS